MFQVNTLFLQKFGWNYSMWNKITYIYVTSNRIFGILEEDDKVYFLRSIENEVKQYKYLSLHSILTDPSNVEDKIEIEQALKSFAIKNNLSEDFSEVFKKIILSAPAATLKDDAIKGEC